MTEQDQLLLSRRVLYRVLQTLYSYPLSREKLEPLLDLSLGQGYLEEEIASLRQAVSAVRDWPEFIENLNVEYTRLFEGPGFVAAPPFASFYLDGERLMGPETIAVRREYVKWGVASVQMGQIPDDHIGLELAFMAYLCDEAAVTLAGGDDGRCRELLEARADFLREHLLIWAPTFCHKIAAATSDPFFASLEKLTLACLESDTALLH